MAAKRRKFDNKFSANTELENFMAKKSSNASDQIRSIDSPTKLHNKYSLMELTKSSSTERSFSVMLDPNILHISL